MSKKKNDDTIVKFIICLIILPIILIIIAIKSILQIINYVIGDSRNKVSYNLILSTDEKEQMSKIDEMDGKEFEKFMTAILIKNGFTNVYTTKASGDYGADILGEYNGFKYAFQCKRFDSKVGARPIGEVLRGMNYYECDKGVVITNNYFTRQAYTEAKACNVELWDRNKVLELCRKTLKIHEESPNVHQPILDKEQKKRLLIVIISACITIGIFFGIKNWYHTTMTKNLNENTISYYELEDTIYDLAKNNVNANEFEVELGDRVSNENDVELNYIIKNNTYSLEEYDRLFKEEITKVYETIKDKKLVWNTIFGEGDCSNVTIYFKLEYKKENTVVNGFLGGIELQYSNDMWESSYNEEMTKPFIRQFEIDEMHKYFQK